ncbi:non-lysosomal glucosylceramidase [Ischnura elegans]|uniref:non-lysosomal glucosylceramidase n=1 Tax=Ischnura elegans TaxID=197161 RepID=UPI001ED8AD49|nr:non-lysosomal glucosylceramidase [Ischnura elegans]
MSSLPPAYGWKVKMNHVFSEKRNQNFKPRLKQIPKLLPLGLRYLAYYGKAIAGGRQPLMDYWHMLTGKQIYGVPIGGIGCGTIGRGFKGEFCRYQLRPGFYEYHVIDANQFIITIQDADGKTIYQQVLSPRKKPRNRLSSWSWAFPGENAHYHGLYPRAWMTYDIPEHNIRLVCRQVSPVIPHNYKDSSLPAAVFVWTIENNSKEVKNVSITFTFKSGTGDKDDRSSVCCSEFYERKNDGNEVSGVLIQQQLKGMPCTYGISASRKEKTNVSRCLSFDPNGNGSDVWNDLLEDGRFTEGDETKRNSYETACGICVNCPTIPAGGSAEVEFSLVWDMPKVNFTGKGCTYTRFYTKYFGKEESPSAALSLYALSNYKRWEEEIKKWQEPVLNDKELPDWYKSAIFNELYFVSDGGSVWFIMEDCDKLSPHDVRKEYGRFSYLEGHEYRMYTSYDVHFYASFALSLLWPKLQLSLQREICDVVLSENSAMYKFLFDGKVAFRKVKNTVPHDLGDPEEEPFLLPNAYPIHDVSEWRDLSSKFVLQAYRDYAVGEKGPADLEHLRALWTAAKLVMERTLSRFDADGDGLIENGGFPDQTYDSWTMEGPSAYCGSLWLAALQCMIEMSKLMGESDEGDKYLSALEKAQQAFETKLWNGKYYNFDSSKSSHSNSIMSDQLCGQWYLRSSGVTKEVFPHDHVVSALKTIYEFNVLKFANGSMGAVNGMTPDGHVDIYTIQSEEVWTGVVYALASLMMHEGMVEEAFKTAEGIYRTVYEQIGMGFETPEALYEKKFYRAIGYMRPLSIWSIQHAWEKRKSAGDAK